MRTTKAIRAREEAAVSAEVAAAGPRITRRQVEATIRTLSANAQNWEASGFPVCAERAWGMVSAAEERLADLDRKVAA